MNVEERFWSKVLISESTMSCWPFVGARDERTGYGKFGVAAGKTKNAHRLAYELSVGEIPTGLQIDHLCRNRSCCNPFHLEPVTSRENTMRGEHPSAIAAKRNCCVRGHEYTPENLYRHGGSRFCRECHRASERRRAERKAASQ